MNKPVLREELSRIKNMMGMIMTEDFNKQEEEPSQNAIDIAHKLLLDLGTRQTNRGLFDDYSYDEFVSFGVEGVGSMTYYFSIDITSHSSYDPGDRWTPPDASPAEWEITPLDIEILDDGDRVVYKGPDFTDFLNFPLSNGKDVEMTMYDLFDEDVQQADQDRW